MSQASDFAAVLRAAFRAGCVKVRGRKHLVLSTPSGERVVCSNSPSDRNAAVRLRRDLVKAGVAL